MTSRPRLHPQYRAVIVEGRGALLLSDLGDRALKGRLFERLIPLIDGESSPVELATRLEAEHPPADVFYTLSLLEAQGYLTSDAAASPASPSMPSVVVAPAPRQVPEPVNLRTIGALPAAECLASLESRGVQCLETAPLTLLLTDSYLRPEIVDVDAEVRAAGGLWLPARITQEYVWIGPVFGGENGACWHCLHHRLVRNRPFDYHLIRQCEGVHDLGSTLPAGDALDAMIAVIADALAGASGRPVGNEFADAILAIEGGIRRRHPVSRRPQCPACGNATAYTNAAEAPIVLRTRPKGSTSIESTLGSFGALVDPLTGVVHDVERAPGASSDELHVWTARFGGNPATETGSLLDRGLRQSAGKGTTDAQARVGSLGEAIERYSAVYQGDESRYLASLEDLGADAIHPNACMLFSDAQYSSPRNLPGSRLHRVPLPLDPRKHIEWTPVWSLTAEHRRFLPTALLYDSCPVPPERSYCVADPTGNAAGNSLEEAVLHGLLELIERDALAIWWYNRIRRPAIVLDAFDDPYIHRLSARYAARGRALWALDLTTDLGIPAVAAVSRRVDGGPDAVLLGFGAHLDLRIALTRALVELTQIDVQVARAEREGRSLDPTLAAWLRDATLPNQPYLEPVDGPAAMTELPRLATGDFLEDIEVCRRALAREGIELLVLDQTRPDIGVPVVKVLAPGLRHFRTRLAPGRLYDVPVSMGWLTEPRAEADLNPIPFFL